MKGVERTGLPVNVIVVSDHGMKKIAQQESSYLLLSDILPANDTGMRFANSGSQVHIYQPDVSKRDALHAELKKKASRYKVLTQSAFPEHWHYQSARVGDILLVADPGYYFVDHARAQLAGFLKPWGWAGVHGYDPSDVPEMKGIFHAVGPNIRSGYTLEPFENIHVYPLVARILGLPLPSIDGRMDVLEKIYRPLNDRSER
jgi:alkaline phosphatase D